MIFVATKPRDRPDNYTDAREIQCAVLPAKRRGRSENGLPTPAGAGSLRERCENKQDKQGGTMARRGAAAPLVRGPARGRRLVALRQGREDSESTKGALRAARVKGGTRAAPEIHAEIT